MYKKFTQSLLTFRTMRVDGYHVDIENLEPDQVYTIKINSQNLNDMSDYTNIEQRTSKFTTINSLIFHR